MREDVTSGTRAVPKRAVRVGQTQSYMSAPNALQTTISSGQPTPCGKSQQEFNLQKQNEKNMKSDRTITYRGLSSGNAAVH